MANLKDLREQRGKLVADARALVAKADAEKRNLTDEENTQYSSMMDQVEALRQQIEREEHLADLEREAIQTERESEERQNSEDPETRATELRAQAFRRYVMGGQGAMSADERRALAFDTDSAGGYLSPPQEFVARLIKAIDDQTFIRRFGTVFPLQGAHSLGVPSLENNPADADWTAEIGSVSEDSTMSFGKRELQPHLLSKLIKVSMKLLRQSVLPAENIVADRLGYKFAITQEKAFLTGSGAAQPLGVFTASANGISTSRDVSTGNTTSSMTTDGLLEAKYSLKGQYWMSAQWLFHRDGVKQIAKLKDGEGQYLWRESVRAGEPDMLLGRPVNMSEYAPNTFTTGLYVGLLGDFSHYWIADSMGMMVQRLNELYAATNQVGFIGRMESDGMPVLEEAFARVKLG